MPNADRLPGPSQRRSGPLSVPAAGQRLQIHNCTVGEPLGRFVTVRNADKSLRVSEPALGGGERLPSPGPARPSGAVFGPCEAILIYRRGLIR